MNKYPKLAIGIITYNRHKEFNTVLTSILDNVIYPREQLRFIICDDGSGEDYVSSFIGREGFTVKFNKRLGMGGNWNSMMRACHAESDFVLCCQDDWQFMEPLDLRVGVRFLQDRIEYGMLRYHKVSGHVGLPMVTESWDTRKYFKNLNDGENEYAPHEMLFFELLPPFDNSNTFSPYSGGVHLRHRRFTRCYGNYKEGKKFSYSEMDFFTRVNGAIRRDLNSASRIAIFTRYLKSRFLDIGVSFRDTETEAETLRSE